MAQRSRLQDVADAAGVSFITAWRALNKPEQVRPKNREKVRAAAAEMGYVVNSLARSLVTAHSGVVGVIVPTLEDSIFSATVQGLSDEFTANGIEMLIGISNYDDQREEDLVRAFVGRQVDGLVLTGKAHSDQTRNLLEKSGLAVVEIWDVPENPVDMFVGFSNRELTYNSTKWLIEKGYQDIAFVSPEGRARALERQAGYEAALIDSELDGFIHTTWTEPTLEGGGVAFQALMAQDKRPDAIFFNGDTLAVGAHLKGAAMGFTYPTDVALMGLHDTAITSYVQPRLSSVRIPRFEIGKSAAQALVQRFANPESKRLEVVDFEIIERETT